ncbi:hypothetical protein ACF09E_32725 [Streptomyces sp. NPDC014891]|uniref:hypothetical protein n=1 Tax=Streptomyces sp. NPDC014891 TaxID=3364929 RepID=UPI0036F964D5
MDWWGRDVIDAGKLPLLVALAAFVLTFAITRVITRLIRAGRGPFGNVSAGGLHIHHVVPGVVLMVCGGFGAVASTTQGLWPCVAALLFGAGAGLVLDEFALLLHLDDVYWSEQGRKSVEAVILTAALGLMLVSGFVPFGSAPFATDQDTSQFITVSSFAWHILMSLLCIAKGKLRLAVFGMFIPLAAMVGAWRLARPESWWARRFYGAHARKTHRSAERAARHDARWNGPRQRVQDALGGAPDR